MITYEEALKRAKKAKKKFDTCRECADGYVFSDSTDRSIGGSGPVVILKSNGDAINYVAFIGNGKYNSTLIKTFKVNSKNK